MQLRIFLAFIGLGLVVGMTQPATAQVTIRSVQTTLFPELEVVVNHRQPEVLDTSQWQFKRGTSTLEHRLDSVVQPPVERGADIFFLIENAPFEEYSDQLVFFQSLIAQALKDTADADDRYFVAHFDWKEMTNPVLNWSLVDGVSDTRAVIDAVNGLVPPPKNGRSHRTTELFPAIDEALRALNERGRPDHPKALVVFSREVQNIYNATPTESDLVRLAREFDIAVNAVGYPPAAPFTKYIGKMKSLVEASYGLRIQIEAGTAPDQYAAQLTHLLNGVAARSSGYDYHFTVESGVEAGSENLGLEVIAGNVRSGIAIPVPSYLEWMWSDSSRRIKLLLTVVGMAMVLIGASILLVRRSSKRRAKEEANRKAQLDALKSDSENVANQLQHERAQREREAADSARRAQEQKQSEALKARQTAFKNLVNKPLLIAPGGVNIAVSQCDLVIGRSASADVRIADDSISGKHAVLAFGNGTTQMGIDHSFYLTDLGSTNGSFVNGVQLQANRPHRLNDNDILVMGTTTLIFRT